MIYWVYIGNGEHEYSPTLVTLQNRLLSMDITQELKQAKAESTIPEISVLIKLSEDYLSLGIYDSACACLKEALLLGESDLEVYNRLGYVNYCQHIDTERGGRGV